MPGSSDDTNDRKRRRMSDHIANKHDAFGSDAVHSLVRNILIVSGADADFRLLISLLRASYGRHVDARTAVGLEGALKNLTAAPASLILLRDSPDQDMRAADVIERLRAAGFDAPVVVIHRHLTARDAIDLRRIGVLDAIEFDDLDSVRLYEALLKAVSGPSAQTIQLSQLPH